MSKLLLLMPGLDKHLVNLSYDGLAAVQTCLKVGISKYCLLLCILSLSMLKATCASSLGTLSSPGRGALGWVDQAAV